MSLITVTREERNGKVSTGTDLIQTDKIALPIREIGGKGYISVIESPLTGRGSENLFIANYLVTENLDAIVALSSDLFKATVVTRDGNTPSAGFTSLVFVADKIMGPIQTEGSGSKFLYHEDNATYPVEFIVSEAPSAIKAAIDAVVVSEAIGGAKTYKATLTQTYTSTTSGSLVIGVTYRIDTLQAGDDFSNVGYTAPGVDFVATGTTPTVWANSTEVINVDASAPVATVLENTLGGTLVFYYNALGDYEATLAGAFPDATKIIMYTQSEGTTRGEIFLIRTDANSINLTTYDVVANIKSDDIIWNTGIVIEVHP